MAAFSQWLIGFVRAAFTWLYNHGIDFVQGAIDGFCTFILSIISLFPSVSVPTPVASPTSSTFTVFISALNWLFPISFFIQIVTFTTSAMLLYAAWMIIGRWLKTHT